MTNEPESTINTEILMMPEGSVGATRRQFCKPVVCGIQVECMANGLELSLMCDLRVMEQSAVLSFFNHRYGLPVIDDGTARLPARIGLSRSLDLILTGREVRAEEAYIIGMANRVVPPRDDMNDALELEKIFVSNSFQQAMQDETMHTSKIASNEMHRGFKWFNKTFKDDNTVS
ncbi:enoyl-CoA hydratase domain-containing protein 2, mitochondrial-like [Glossina fuscipes]|uniref:Enoyl-CoA hydratase domain-containing protein 2, mitochondrial-like n=1 Tax=Glossina fuscipes TaxID=7396 RepID=A0A9C5ZNL8_9MUSC|nr:enoyl-CoA hydratase domain-containing protein 2, mitochondrial-like [Glossina fuscipes]